MSWEDLARLPEEVAAQIELWDGRVVWVRRGPAEHQAFMFNVTAALKRCARQATTDRPEHYWRADLETNVFFGHTGKSDFATPDFLVYRCLKTPYQDVRADDVVLVGEVLSPSNTHTDVEAKKARYSSGGIPWYWEITLAREASAIDTVRAYALETEPGRLPAGVHPLRPANYLLVGEWTADDRGGIEIGFPFPIDISWSELEF
ncbi:Uma2 family endonuclease [Nocardia uniformis]|uniref:Uma2 family endonuclease n=2 Tax=Nocardia uniformis TaxID=53432 RepID=A0A849C4P0_9NOCA|nr:Uma2 family endonuclease [Nocardia uniformis]